MRKNGVRIGEGRRGKEELLAWRRPTVHRGCGVVDRDWDLNIYSYVYEIHWG